MKFDQHNIPLGDIVPLGNFVLLRILEVGETESDGGIILPERRNPDSTLVVGEIVSVGDGEVYRDRKYLMPQEKDDDLEYGEEAALCRAVSYRIEVGKHVLVTKYDGKFLPDKLNDHMLIDAAKILAVVD